MENIIRNYFVNKKAEKEESQLFPNLKKLNLRRSSKYMKTIELLNNRLVAYQKEGKLSPIEVAIITHLHDEMMEIAIETLKVDIYTKILQGVTDAKSKL